MDDINCIWCGPDNPPASLSSKYVRTVHLDSIKRTHNVHLKIENISSLLAQDIPSIVMDMLEIGSYVYCADQSISRGGETFPQKGNKWRRKFQFDIPVRNLDVWNKPEVKTELSDVLGFLSDDYYEFSFRQPTEMRPYVPYFDYEKGNPWFEADEVLLFSGGLDSLSGALDEMINQDRKVVLVSHRPVAIISKRQTDLLKAFKEKDDLRHSYLHVPIWVNKDKGLTKDSNQRSRSFLYVMLGASVAVMHKISHLKFYENGITSCNLPPSEQVIGSRASRSTHPAVLRGYSKLLSAVLDTDFAVTNPFIFKTKSEVVRIIKDVGRSDLIRLSNSCSHIRSMDSLNTHCGVCSQCIGRQFAILHNGLSEFDSQEMYKSRLLMDPIDDPKDRVMVASLVEQARYYDSMDDGSFFGRFGEVNRILDCLGSPTSKTAEAIYDLHKRYGLEVQTVLTEQLQSNANAIAKGEIAPDSLLAMIVGYKKRRTTDAVRMQTFPTPPNTAWKDITIEIISQDSARIRVKGITRVYNVAEIGFVDRRKGDLPNKQWDLLVSLAENVGQLNWETRQEKRNLYKTMQSLRNLLRRLFNLSGEPIKSYEKRVGYIANFQIADLRQSR